MTHEEKQLLLIDLCARLPYGIKTSNGHGILKLSPRTDIIYIVDNGHIPYLRLMSSMTEEERKEFMHIFDGPIIYDENSNLVTGFECNTFEQFVLLENWLNSHHFDYRGLIEKGLALEAPDDMYKNE